MPSDADAIVLIIQALFQAYTGFLNAEFDLPLIGTGKWFLFLSILFWIGTVLLIFAKVVATICSIGKGPRNA